MAGSEKRQLSLETIKTWYWGEVIGLQLSHYFPLTLINFSDGTQDLVAGSPAKEDQVFSIWTAFPAFSEYFPTPGLWWSPGSLLYMHCVGPLWTKAACSIGQLRPGGFATQKMGKRFSFLFKIPSCLYCHLICAELISGRDNSLKRKKS